MTPQDWAATLSDEDLVAVITGDRNLLWRHDPKVKRVYDSAFYDKGCHPWSRAVEAIFYEAASRFAKKLESRTRARGMSKYPKGYGWMAHAAGVCVYKGEPYFIHGSPYMGRSPTDPSKDIFWLRSQRKRRARILAVPLSEVFATPRTQAVYEMRQAEMRATLSLSVDRAFAEEVVADINTAVVLARENNMRTDDNKVFLKPLLALKKLLMDKLIEQ